MRYYLNTVGREKNQFLFCSGRSKVVLIRYLNMARLSNPEPIGPDLACIQRLTVLNVREAEVTGIEDFIRQNMQVTWILVRGEELISMMDDCNLNDPN